MNSIFEFATRNKLRFPYKGSISVEDLWDLSQKQLNDVYKILKKELKLVSEEENLMSLEKEDPYIELNIKVEIVKHIFNVKKVEAQQREDAVIKAEKKQRILDILAKKQDDSLNNMSEDELIKMLDALS